MLVPNTPRRLPSIAAVCLAMLSAGCVQVYQPLSGLHAPVVVDPRVPNFQGVRLTIYCFPGDLLSAQEASTLCQRVETLFENQGAVVSARTSTRAESAALGELAPGDDGPVTADLVLELRSRLLNESNDQVRWALCIATSTLVPGVIDMSFAQDVVVRDGSGFLLASDSLQGRIVRRYGVTAWLGNAILNYTVREPDERVVEETAGEELSADLYQQLTQLVFNAKMRWQVLHAADGEGTSW